MALSNYFRGKLKGYFMDKWGMYEYRRGWLKGDCPYCGRDNKFGVHLGKDLANCFVCGPHGSLLEAVGDLEGIYWEGDIKKFLGTFDYIEYVEPKVEAIEAKPVTFPEGWVPLNNRRGDSTMHDMICNYLGSRGLDPGALGRKGFGYCIKGDLFGYLIMPFYSKDKLIYYHTRNILGTGPKFDNPPIDKFGIGKATVIYNVDALWLYDTCYIVESVLNAETIGDNATATGGKHPSRYQISTYIKAPCKNYIIILDDDALKEAVDLAFTLIDYKRIKLIWMPKGKDVNALGRRATLDIVHKVRYMEMKDLFDLKLAANL